MCTLAFVLFKENDQHCIRYLTIYFLNKTKQKRFIIISSFLYLVVVELLRNDGDDKG